MGRDILEPALSPQLKPQIQSLPPREVWGLHWQATKKQRGFNSATSANEWPRLADTGMTSRHLPGLEELPDVARCAEKAAQPCRAAEREVGGHLGIN